MSSAALGYQGRPYDEMQKPSVSRGHATKHLFALTNSPKTDFHIKVAIFDQKKSRRKPMLAHRGVKTKCKNKNGRRPMLAHRAAKHK